MTNRTKKEKAKVWFSFVLYKETAFFNKSGLYSANFKKSNINHWCWFLIFATISGQWILQKDHLEVLKTIWWTKFIRHVTKQTIIIATKQLKRKHIKSISSKTTCWLIFICHPYQRNYLGMKFSFRTPRTHHRVKHHITKKSKEMISYWSRIKEVQKAQLSTIFASK
jgi:hypothetical protein